MSLNASDLDRPGGEDDMDNYTCTGSTDEQLDYYDRFNFWSEGVVKPLICLIGILGNSFSIPVLLSRAMDSVFNRLLVWLTACDSLYLLLSVMDCFRKHWGTVLVHKYSFGYVLYGLHNIVMACSIYMTVSLAMERYLAVSRPVEYHISVNTGKRWVRIARYVLPVFLFSIAFMVPKFYELRPVEILENRTVLAVDGSGGNASSSSQQWHQESVVVDVRIAPTPLRLNQIYSFYYNNAARMLFTGVVPFCLLMGFNYGIYKAVKRRRDAFGGPPSAAQSAQSQAANEENRQAILLFAIVTFFLLFNTPRNFLNLYEVARFDQIKEDYDHNCGGLPLWVLLVGSVSHILLAVNSSMNFFLYCLMSTTFRTELCRMLGSATSRVLSSGGALALGGSKARLRMRRNNNGSEANLSHTNEIVRLKSSSVAGGGTASTSVVAVVSAAAKNGTPPEARTASSSAGPSPPRRAANYCV